MYKDIYIIGTATVVVGCLFFAYRTRVLREPNPIKRAFKLYQVHLAAIGTLLAVVWFTIPLTSPLATSGSGLLANIKSPEELQVLLQTYNRELQRTTAALHWFLIIFVGWFLLNTYRLCATLSSLLADRAEG
ncbi:MAG: hypothetical protein QOF72_3011 [Blastocatellia bacterium]|jgi:hypothetical protein|nr:hypothetical protein [Blastocatellia bacterium]